MPEIIDYTKVGGTFQDTGEGDVDFYTYWYSICYVVGMLNTYRYIFRDVEQYEEMMRRFLNSRGITNVNSSTVEELLYLYNHWEQYLEKRGTVKINESINDSQEVGLTGYIPTGIIQTDITANNGVGVLSNAADLSGVVNSTVDLGYNHTMEFDLLLSDSLGAQYVVDGSLFNNPDNYVGISINTPADPFGISNYLFTYAVGGVTVGFNIDLDINELQHIKIVRVQSKVSLIINDILVGVEQLSASYDYSFDMLFTSGLPAIANIKLVSKDDYFVSLASYNWLCNEGSGFTLECNKALFYYAVLGVTSMTDWDSVWVRDGRFNNTNYVGIDGELKRLLNYQGGEHLFELISTAELGLSIDISSLISEEASCKNLNKAFEKGEIIKLSKFPVTFTNTIKPYVDSGYIVYDLLAANGVRCGINTVFDNTDLWSVNLDSKPSGLVPFIPIPIATEGDNFEDYEISFVINSTTNIDIKFGVNVYDRNYVRIVDALNKYVDDTPSDVFLNESDFSLATGRDVLVRAMLSVNKGSYVSDSLNINMGDNLYIDGDENIRFVLPIISFLGTGTDTLIKIKDIVVRPANMSTSKGVVSNKNKIISYLKNNSGQSDDTITDIIEQKLIPYNCTTNIQYL